MIVKEFDVPGAHIRIADDCYRDASPEELARRRKEISRVAHMIARNEMIRQAQEENKNEHL